MRDRLVHDYANVDVNVLATVVDQDLPDLVAKIDQRLEKAPEGIRVKRPKRSSAVHVEFGCDRLLTAR